MIIEWLLDLIEGAFTFVVGLFPESSFDPIATFSGLVTVLAQVNYFVPLAELLALVVGFLAVGIPFIAVSLVLWIIALLRGGSARG